MALRIALLLAMAVSVAAEMATCEDDEAGLLQKTSVESLKEAKAHSAVACDCPGPDCAGCGCTAGQFCNINGEQEACPPSGLCSDLLGPPCVQGPDSHCGPGASCCQGYSCAGKGEPCLPDAAGLLHQNTSVESVTVAKDTARRIPVPPQDMQLIGASAGTRLDGAIFPVSCFAGQSTQCPGSSSMCAGNQCCPGIPWSGGKTFVCPSATSIEASNCAFPHKAWYCA